MFTKKNLLTLLVALLTCTPSKFTFAESDLLSMIVPIFSYKENPQIQEIAITKSPYLSNLGVKFGEYSNRTRTAGAFKFNIDKYLEKILWEFGEKVNRDQYGNWKDNPTIAYALPMDTDIYNVIYGKITAIRKQVENDYVDYEFDVTPILNDNFIVIYDHVVDLRFKLGDVVKGGEILGKAARWGNVDYGRLEIQLNSKGRTPFAHICPLKYFDPDLIVEQRKWLQSLANDWEKYKHDDSIYNSFDYDIACKTELLIP